MRKKSRHIAEWKKRKKNALVSARSKTRCAEYRLTAFTKLLETSGISIPVQVISLAVHFSGARVSLTFARNFHDKSARRVDRGVLRNRSKTPRDSQSDDERGAEGGGGQRGRETILEPSSTFAPRLGLVYS
jgi:hypothetical protein